jgi:ankyrin repeat protein
VDSRENGKTPLQQAINTRPGGDDSAWRETKIREEREVVNLLLAAGAAVEVRGRDGNRPLHQAAMFGQVEIAELLIDHGADLNARNDWNYTPLHYAATMNQPDVFGLLLERGADPNVRNKAGRTPLAEASGNARFEAILKRAGVRR